MKQQAAKTGIITVHRNTNYGANLQAYASCQFLNQNGIPACIVDYLPPEQDWENHFFSLYRQILKNEPNKSPKRMLKLCASLMLSAPQKAARLRKFCRFRKKYMHLSSKCDTLDEIAALGLDTLVCGSDQIWNAAITRGLNPAYFGDVRGIKNRVSYAASMGGYTFTEEEKLRAEAMLRRLCACSVREEDTKTYVQGLGREDVQVVCDPVFLLDKSDYCRLAGKRRIREKYLLVYSIIDDGEMVEKAKEYALQHGCRLVEICAGKNRRATHTQLADLGPEEFLNTFCYADAIFTNSFHGTAFSIIFEKQFYIFNNKHGGSRLTNLLEKAGIPQRRIYPETSIGDLTEQIDYVSVGRNLQPHIAFSREFLQNSVNGQFRTVAGSGCVGCGACEESCPVNAITMVENAEGFWEAVIHNQKCIQCGRCEKVCPALRPLEDKNGIISVYAFKAADALRKHSTSGGAFSAIAEAVLKENGVVYGAAMDKDFAVRHIPAENEEQLAEIRGVKYVQSDTSQCFASIARDLQEGKTVLFTGTPCQVSGLKAFVEQKRISTQRLLLTDIVCHGIPSPYIFKSYIQWLEDKEKAKVVAYKFRDKGISWRGHSASVLLDDGRVLSATPEANAYMNVYYSGCTVRQSCYQCRYTTNERISDLTISDYWGIENTSPDFEDKLGVSMVLVNTPKGEALMAQLQGAAVKTSLNGAKQPQLSNPCEKPADREAFWAELNSKGVDFIMKKYGGLAKPGLLARLRSKVYSMIKK